MLPNISREGQTSLISSHRPTPTVFLPAEEAKLLSIWALLFTLPSPVALSAAPVCLPPSLTFGTSEGYTMASLSQVPLPHLHLVCTLVSAVLLPPSQMDLFDLSSVSPFRLDVFCGSWLSEITPRQSTMRNSKCQRDSRVTSSQREPLVKY